MTLNHDRRGDGPPLVLLHGIGSRWQVFEPVIDALALRHTVYSVDLPGFGGSAADPAVTASPGGYAERLVGFFAERGIDSPHVVGNSMGGGVALELGRMGVAGRVTAFSPVGFWHTPGRLWSQGLVTGMRWAGIYVDGLLARLAQPAPIRAVLLAAFYGRPTRVTPETAMADVRALAGATMFAEARDAFSGYRFAAADQGALPDIPVTVAWGTRDILLAHGPQSRRARRFIPYASHVDLPGCGHLPFNDDPELCAGTILDVP